MGDRPPTTVPATRVPPPPTPSPVSWFDRRDFIKDRSWSEPMGLPLQQTSPLATQYETDELVPEMDEPVVPAAVACNVDLDAPGQAVTLPSVEPVPASVTVDATSAVPILHASTAASPSYDLRLRLTYDGADFGAIEVQDDLEVDQLLEQAATRILVCAEDLVGIVNGCGYQYGLGLGNIGELRTTSGIARGAEVDITLDQVEPGW